MFLASTTMPRPLLLPWANANPKKRDSRWSTNRKPTTAALQTLQLHQCGGKQTYLQVGKAPQELKNRTKKDWLKHFICTSCSSAQLVYQLTLRKYQDWKISAVKWKQTHHKHTRCQSHLLCLCFCVWEEGQFPAIAISYTFFPQCCFIVCLLGGQRMHVQPSFTEALFMLPCWWRVAAWSWSSWPSSLMLPGVQSNTCQSAATPQSAATRSHVGK